MRFREMPMRRRSTPQQLELFPHACGRRRVQDGAARQMIDASIIEAPRQRNTEAEKDDLKAGRIPEEWEARPAKLRRKDRDGRRTLKRGRRKRRPDGSLMMEVATPACGCQSHIGADRRYRLIRTRSATDAARCDGREIGGLPDRSNTASSVWAIVPREVVQIVLRLGVEPVYRAAIFAGSMVLSSQMAATVPNVM